MKYALISFLSFRPFPHLYVWIWHKVGPYVKYPQSQGASKLFAQSIIYAFYCNNITMLHSSVHMEIRGRHLMYVKVKDACKLLLLRTMHGFMNPRQDLHLYLPVNSH